MLLDSRQEMPLRVLDRHLMTHYDLRDTLQRAFWHSIDVARCPLVLEGEIAWRLRLHRREGDREKRWRRRSWWWWSCMSSWHYDPTDLWPRRTEVTFSYLFVCTRIDLRAMCVFVCILSFHLLVEGHLVSYSVSSKIVVTFWYARSTHYFVLSFSSVDTHYSLRSLDSSFVPLRVLFWWSMLLCFASFFFLENIVVRCSYCTLT